MNKSPFLYYFPNAQRPPEWLEFRFRNNFTRRQCAGPEGRGLVATPFSGVELPTFDKENYQWRKVRDVHFGIRRGIAPSELIRPEAVGGYWVKLGDDQEWIIPVAMLDAPNFSLSRYEDIDENGNWIWKVQDKHAAMTALAEKVWAAVDDDGGFAMDEQVVRGACLAALAVNYDITAEEAAFMKLLTEDAYQRIIAALIDLPGKRDIIAHAEGKKKLSGEPDVNSGGTDSLPSTAQPSQI